MSRQFLLGAAIGLMACSDTSFPPTTTKSRGRDCDYANSEESERRAKFITECAAAANPHSDEEGEDLVEACAATADKLFCPFMEVTSTCSARGIDRVCTHESVRL